MAQAVLASTLSFDTIAAELWRGGSEFGEHMASAAPTDGACEFQQWANALRFELGSDGKEDLLEGNGMAVVMDYARSDMERAAADLQVYPGCSVLEIGFGLGFASAVIQSRRP